METVRVERTLTTVESLKAIIITCGERREIIAKLRLEHNGRARFIGVNQKGFDNYLWPKQIIEGEDALNKYDK